MEIGQKLKEQRTERNLSQEKLAAQLGVTRQTVASWEKGKTYPDIGNILKLSDLYGVSLDELLKEDADMKQHMEKTAAFTEKLWNGLFVTAVLLLPASMLLYYWGLVNIGLTAKLLSMALLLLVLVFRWRSYGWKQKELVIGLFFWAVFFLPDLIGLAAPREETVRGFTFEYILFGIFLIYSYGICFQTKLAYLLTIGIFFSTPVYITLSTHLPGILEQGITGSDTVFGKQYFVEEVLYQAPEGKAPVQITLDLDGETLVMDGDVVGQFLKMPSEPGENRMTWKLIPEGDPTGRITLSGLKPTGGFLQLEYRREEADISRLLWSVRLAPVEQVRVRLTQENSEYVDLLNWYSKELMPEQIGWLSSVRVEGKAAAAIQMEEETITKLKVVEEYHWAGQTEIREWDLEKDRTGVFPLPEEVFRRYDAGEQYAVYKIPWNDGEYILLIDFE